MLLLLLACQRPPSPDDSTAAVDDSVVVDDTSAEEVPLGMFPGRYLMTFFSCDRDICMDPSAFNHEVWVLWSDDGVSWQVPTGDFEPWTGSVPDMTRRGDTLYVYAGPGEVRRYRFESDTWEDPVPFTNDVQARWRDPAPLVGDDGLIHMFYLDSAVEDGDPADCTADRAPCTQRFGSAVEVEGSDGVDFVIQEGSRFELTLQAGDRASDPAVFATPFGYVMYILLNEATLALVSDTLHGRYTPVAALPEGMLTEPYYGLMVGQWDHERQLIRSYASVPLPRGQGQQPDIVIQLAEHADLDAPLTAWQTVVEGGDPPELPEGYWAASPGLAENVRFPEPFQ
ncbi:MAG: hypothetical protein H6739_12625 [Alphaproteobacteria bacterium]|nr:hypothetical protein [Alphaproteobacteria bacterium]